MIRVTKLNDEEFVINCSLIERIEMIPESKIIMTNKDFYIVKESVDEIIDRVIEFNAMINSAYKRIVVEQEGDNLEIQE